MPRLALLALAPLSLVSLSCAEPARAPLAAVPIKSACTAGSRPPSAVGFDVRPGRRHSQARTLFATNLSDRPRTVRVQRVTRLEGACSEEWARSTSLDFIDASTCEPPREVTVRPGEWLQLSVGDQRVAPGEAQPGRSAAPTWDCVKLGIALWMEVDGEEICADAGAWIAERESGERE